MKSKITIFILFIVVISCQRSQTPIERINKKLSIGKGLPFRKEIPIIENDSSLRWSLIRSDRYKIGLPSIENGSQNVSIRIWEELDSAKAVFILSHANNSWSAERYIYKAVSSNGIFVDSIKVVHNPLGTPKSGWNRFLNKFIDYGILNINDESNIQGYFIATDLHYVAVEISAKDYYKHYQLSGLNSQPKNLSDVKSMISILTLIRTEFSI
jgi:hypothetical protein